MNYKLLLEENSYGRLLEIGKVEEVYLKKSLLKISFYNKEGFLEDVVLLGTYKPVKGDIGIIFYAGNSGYPFFLPYYSGQQYSNAGNDTIILDKVSGSPDIATDKWVNLQDVGASIISAGKLEARSPKDNQWGESSFINALVQSAINWSKHPLNNGTSIMYVRNISNKMWYKKNGRVGANANFKGHAGWGHKTGRGADIGTTDRLHTADVNSGNIDKQIGLMESVLNGGVLKILYNNDKYQNRYTEKFGRRVAPDSKGQHYNHFHVSNIPFEEGTGY